MPEKERSVMATYDLYPGIERTDMRVVAYLAIGIAFGLGLVAGAIWL